MWLIWYIQGYDIFRGHKITILYAFFHVVIIIFLCLGCTQKNNSYYYLFHFIFNIIREYEFIMAFFYPIRSFPIFGYYNSFFNEHHFMPLCSVIHVFLLDRYQVIELIVIVSIHLKVNAVKLFSKVLTIFLFYFYQECMRL